MALVPGKVVTLHQAVPPIQSLELPVAVPLGTGVMVGGAEGLLAEEGSPITVIVSVGYPIGVKHVVVPASVLDQGAAMISEPPSQYWDTTGLDNAEWLTWAIPCRQIIARSREELWLPSLNGRRCHREDETSKYEGPG